ncbi:MAG: DUF1559 domain-containing protein, partial [Planctomycetales bacterium]
AFFCLIICGGIMAALLLPAVHQAREAARRTMSKNNLKQIGLALHNYHDVYSGFPPGAIAAEDGTNYLGWQASLLPYVDQSPLFSQIQMGEAWNGPLNKPLYTQPVQAYWNPAISEQFSGDGLALSHYAGNSQVFPTNVSFGIRNMKDGTSNTLLVGEVSAGLKPWGDPTNLRDPAAGLGRTPTQFGGPFQNGTTFLLADGSVRFLLEDINPEILKALSTPDGGEDVSSF